MSVKAVVRALPAISLPEIHLGGEWQEVLALTVQLLRPASLGAFVLAFWRFAADLGWTSDFLIADGILSHWQVWVALGVSMLFAQTYITRTWLKSEQA